QENDERRQQGKQRHRLVVICWFEAQDWQYCCGSEEERVRHIGRRRGGSMHTSRP
ncbi:unnamed protein product, partial [Ectocarpus sp. 4 AP-2014]